MSKNGKTQPTQPVEGDPVEIPVPTRGEVLRDLGKVAKPRKKDGSPDK
jgi:hypothetical protein